MSRSKSNNEKTGFWRSSRTPAQRDVAAALRECEEHCRIVVETIHDAILLFDERGQMHFANSAASTVFGYTSAELLAQNLSLLIPDGLHHLDPAQDANTAIELRGVHKDGHIIPLNAWFTGFRRQGHKAYIGVIHDTSERRRAEEMIRLSSQHDALTGLPNRALFYDRVVQAIAHAKRHQKTVAVLFLDLDGFKQVNDTLGHPIGDELLCMVAKRLLACVRSDDSVGRLGGDEFVVALPMHFDDSAALSIANKILQAMCEPFLVKQNALHISASIGIGIYPKDGDNAKELMSAADSAMYHAKKLGRNNCQFFTQRLNEASRRRLLIAKGLQQAMSRKELILDFQPMVDLKTGHIFALESMPRWHHEELGWVPPAEFMRVAEETGLISAMGEWVLLKSCQIIAQWRGQGYPELRIAVNVSAGQFRAAGFADMVRRVLRQTRLPAVALDLEINESVLMNQNATNIAMLTELAGMGVQFTIDDFGSGRSSVASLKRFPIDAIKLDQSFVQGLLPGSGVDSGNKAIIDAILAMAENLRLTVIAAGVENKEQVAYLHSRGCLAAQGGLYQQLPADADFVQLMHVAEAPSI